ncbi:hypothetical protein Plhal304r1_c018g0065591 [Plasmopara halstedii]
MTSDRRLEKNIQSCPIDRVKRLYDKCEVKLYDWIESEIKPGQEIGDVAAWRTHPTLIWHLGPHLRRLG